MLSIFYASYLLQRHNITNSFYILKLISCVSDFFLLFFQIFGTSSITFVRRRVGEAFDPKFAVPTIKFVDGTMMVWGCMSSVGPAMLYNCEDRMNSNKYIHMLEQVFRPSWENMYDNNIPGGVIFQQDNTPCHTSRLSMRWFENNEMRILMCFPQSPDMNPIEYLWSHLGAKVREHKCSSKQELTAKIHEE